MKNYRLLLLFMALLCAFTVKSQTTHLQYLSGKDAASPVKWKFYCTEGRNSGKWTTISVPACWETEGFGTLNYGHDKNPGKEKGFYKTTFTIPKDWKSQRVFLVFEGSMTDTKVKVNGQQAGEVHQGSFYRFKREITNLVKFTGKNKLEVDVSKVSENQSVNEAERTADFWIFGGIYRPVYLEAVPNHFIDYTAINARHDGYLSAEVNLDSEMEEVSVLFQVKELKTGRLLGSLESTSSVGKTKKITLSGVIPSVKAWSDEHPYLYEATVLLQSHGKLIHSTTQKIGFRTIEVKARDGVYVNGEKIRFKGVNRHCFWPTTGRAIGREMSKKDALLIKGMNMNAVRMSHYPPDVHFLELCDSLGLYAIDELCSWQWPPYDTKVGSKLVPEMVERDVNHPCIVFWANGNEGGFNYDLDPLFPAIDIQKRAILHPWGFSGNINTVHYINYNSGIKEMFNGREIFMPTELLHGLYDGGHGAGLDDYWNLMCSNPLSAGLFLWDFVDQGVVRIDRGSILDTDKDHGADGIVGPYREKEGSFYTIKEIWSPIAMEKRYITPQWNGILNFENRYLFTNSTACSFQANFLRYSLKGVIDSTTVSIESPSVAPGNKGRLKLALPSNWMDYDVLHLTAKDWNGKELFTWSYELASPEKMALRELAVSQENTKSTSHAEKVSYMENDSLWILSASGVEVSIQKRNGLLHSVSKDGVVIPLSNGPIFVSNNETKGAKAELIVGQNLIRVKTKCQGNDFGFTWALLPSGILQLDYGYRPDEKVEMAGVTFSFPEENIKGAKLLAKGPYRVYANRMKGGMLDLWNKKYNNAITGERWEYPEFKGYYAQFYALELECATPFQIYSGTEDMILHLFTPEVQKNYDPSKNYTNPTYPKGNISFMEAIPAVGTKFGKAENYGPQSQLHDFKTYGGTANLNSRVYFNFVSPLSR